MRDTWEWEPWAGVWDGRGQGLPFPGCCCEWGLGPPTRAEQHRWNCLEAAPTPTCDAMAVGHSTGPTDLGTTTHPPPHAGVPASSGRGATTP